MKNALNDISVANGPEKTERNGLYWLLEKPGNKYIGVEITFEAFEDSLSSNKDLALNCAIDYASSKPESEWKSTSTVKLSAADIRNWLQK